LSIKITSKNHIKVNAPYSPLPPIVASQPQFPIIFDTSNRYEGLIVDDENPKTKNTIA